MSFSKQLVYESFMVLLAMLSIATIWTNVPFTSYIIWITWGIFFVDLLYRLYKSTNRFAFIKTNPFLILAAIPFDAVFQVARLARILHILRLKTITKYYTKPIVRFLEKQHKGLAFVVILGVIGEASGLMIFFEPAVTTIPEAILAALTALTFFGESGITPITSIGHVIVVLLTIIGVIIHGFILSYVIDYLSELQWLKMMHRKWKSKMKE